MTLKSRFEKVISENEIGVKKRRYFWETIRFYFSTRRHSQTASALGRTRLDGAGRGGTGRHWTVHDGAGRGGTGRNGAGRDWTGGGSDPGASDPFFVGPQKYRRLLETVSRIPESSKPFRGSSKNTGERKQKQKNETPTK